MLDAGASLYLTGAKAGAKISDTCFAFELAVARLYLAETFDSLKLRSNIGLTMLSPSLATCSDYGDAMFLSKGIGICISLLSSLLVTSTR